METWQIVVLVLLAVVLYPNRAWLGLLWALYAAVMNMKEAQLALKAEGRDFKPFQKSVGAVTLLLGLLVDFRCNVIECTFIFKDLPRETLVTSRLKRYVNGTDEKRKAMALQFEDDYQLNRMDPSGNHLD